MPGHDLGHERSLPPVGLAWSDYVGGWVEDRGSWTGLADELMARAAQTSGFPSDLQTVERGLRRLAKRDRKPGGQYGRWMLRFFGFTTDVGNWVKWMGQYHTRFADLPSSLRLSQLRLWNRPPVEESRLASWIELGLASVHQRLADYGEAERWLSRAETRVARAGVAAEIEADLFRAKLETDAGNRDAARMRFAQVEERLNEETLVRADALCYRARLAVQRGYHLTKEAPGEQVDFLAASALFTEIEEDVAVPFASFCKHSGLAYCRWKLGDTEEGAALARRAADFAGDGGLVRFRVMALNMLAGMVDANERELLRERAARMARQLEDEDLMQRVSRKRRRSASEAPGDAGGERKAE